jgi:CubicO group peptidase (beta-lactamase class C family)
MTIGRAHRHHRHIMAAVLAATVATMSAAGAQVPLPDTPEAFGAVLKSWAATHGAKQAFVVVRRDGHIVHRSAIGGIDPRTPVQLASLSKAITGACIATLVRDGKLAFDTPVSSALAKFITDHGKPRDPRFARVTVAQLLTHRAGFGTKRDDPATGPALVQYLLTNSASARPTPAFLASAINHRLETEPGAKFVYSNTGYMALGAVIEEATGAQYVPYCRNAVLAPLGLAGELEPRWRVLWSYGGWRMTADDYLAFLDLFDAQDQRLGATAKSWMLDSTDKSTGGQPWYGLGTYVRKGDGGVTVRHFGSWAYNMTGGKDGSLHTSFLTFATRQSDGTAWFVYVTPRIEQGKPREELAADLAAAYRGVKKWN